MTIFQSLFLGIVQGITEFLPISSSGHLVIIPYLFGWDLHSDADFVFNVLIQVATMTGVIAYFWREYFSIGRAMLMNLGRREMFKSQEARLGWLIVISTLPAGIAGFLLKDIVESAFNSPLAAASFLLATALLLSVAERFRSQSRSMDQTTWQDALIIGLFQALALFPGLSRSGSTITGGMLRGLQRSTAARFAFLMALPIMLAAGLSAGIDLLRMPGVGNLLIVYIPGFLVAAITGYLSISWLLRFLVRYSLYYFAIYCSGLAVLTFVVYWMRH